MRDREAESISAAVARRVRFRPMDNENLCFRGLKTFAFEIRLKGLDTMRRVIALLSVAATLSLRRMWLRPASLLGIITSCSNNWGNSGMPWNSPGGLPGQLPDGPFATTDGEPFGEDREARTQLNWQDVNIQADFRAAFRPNRRR